MFHTCRASPSGTEKADERADGDDDALGTLDPVRARSIQDESPQNSRGISAGVITNSIEKSNKDSLIDIECCRSQSTMSAHPRTEFSQDGPSFSSGWPGYRLRKLASQSEESNE
jgi:hypothetical protein